MDRMTARTFNGPLEAGVRSVALLVAAYPAAYDIRQLTIFDYLLVRTSELNGPESLHPPSPVQSPDATVRRKIVQAGIDLMISRSLICREPSLAGITFVAGDAAAPFLDSLASPYLERMKERADWIAAYFKDRPQEAVAETVQQIFDKWVAEFQDLERSWGASA
ncbi:threonine transporter [Methylocystis sp. WRRC1]|uniref:ABC-three component system middle component 2 n=1 Tax=Methylocystis sp. WRRC1 TaxID=1732014 RepID=UPI001D159A16|nr:ABC-three component system middle component 2 [Methylocystis sp. WRRC1]MCC3243807.1 threonine transporter [Methylocystis sp. WRRC1]